jgi:hypothetical protein
MSKDDVREGFGRGQDLKRITEGETELIGRARRSGASGRGKGRAG